MSDDDKIKHYEDELVRMTAIPREKLTDDQLLKEKEEREELRKHGLIIRWEDSEFVLRGFTSWKRKGTEKWIFHYKFNHKERLILYHIIEEDETFDVVGILKMLALPQGYEVRNIMDYIEDIMNIQDKVRGGEIKLKDGAHPNMKDCVDDMTMH